MEAIISMVQEIQMAFSSFPFGRVSAIKGITERSTR
jgi:hypothetical protein